MSPPPSSHVSKNFCPARRSVLHGSTAVLASGTLLPRPSLAVARGNPVFVLNSLDADISVIEAGSYKPLQRIPTGKEPHHLYLAPDNRSLLVANARSNSISFVDPVTAQVQRTVSGIVDPYHLRFSPDMKWLVTAANRLNHVDLYHWLPGELQPLKLAKRIAAPQTPSHLAIDSRSSVVYASLQDSDELVAIDLASQSIRWKVPTGRMPADVFLGADDKTLLLALTGDSVVEAWDVSQPLATPKRPLRITTAKGAHAFRSAGDARHVFVSNRVANSISRIDLQTLKVVGDPLPAPGGPDCMELLADGRTLLVTSRWARLLTVIDTHTRQVVLQVPVGRSPHGVWTLDHAPRG